LSTEASRRLDRWCLAAIGRDLSAARHRRLQPGGTSEFAAISAVVQRHNEISNVLSTAPHRFVPLHSREPNGDVDAAAWTGEERA